MKYTQMLRFNYEFSRVYNRGVFASGKHVVVHCFKRPKNLRHNLISIRKDINRAGFTGSRKIRGAVRRNRARRLLRESFRRIESDLIVGYDLVIMVKYAEPLPSFQEVDTDLKRLMKRLSLLKDKDDD
jgi:ribonuclease P protein component